MYRKIITILITGMVFTAGLAVSFGIPVFAGDPVPGLHIYIEQIPGGKVSTQRYGSSLSNKSVGLVRMEVGNILLSYGVGGADINKVTEALEGGGVYEAELKSFLIAIGINEEGVQGIFLKLDGIDIKSTEAVSVPDAGDTPRSKPYIKIQGIPGESQDARAAQVAREAGREVFHDEQTSAIQNLKSATAPEERKNFINELRANRGIFLTEIVSVNLGIRENAKELRDNFRFLKIDTADGNRIALAHGKGLRMLNRFRSAMARFDHILGRLESRIEKFEAQGIDVSSTILLIEEAKNMSVESEAKMEELKTKYESLLLGENVGGVAKEARAIATELKVEIENLRAIIIEVYIQGNNYNSSRSALNK
ncbi:MAG: hypothetical protein Q8N65_01730 [bacterium]|nr:hypothetical protein [bacterium]